MPAVNSPPKQRRSARAILLSPTKEVLLISFVVSRSDGEFAFWATPGGEVEEGEDDLAAAQRELREELELTVDLLGPVHLSEAHFEHNGALVLSTDVFFIGRCEREAPRLRPFTLEERAVIRSSRWWSLDEIETTGERVFPEGLSTIVKQFVE
jgi:8-oxo-dGTP diphosphatase